MRKLSSQGISHLILPIVVVVVVGTIGTLVYVVSHAQSITSNTTVTPAATTIKDVNLCLRANSNLCLQADGTGHNNQLRVSDNSVSRWTIKPVSGGYHIYNQKGNCAEAYEGIAILDRGCSGIYDIWTMTGSYLDRKFSNDGIYLGTFSPNNGGLVITRSEQHSFYYSWVS